jgi:hypothetical protein
MRNPIVVAGLASTLFLPCLRAQEVLQNWTAPATDFFGASVDSAGDVNQDGVEDVIVGAPETGVIFDFSGYATVFCGANGNQLYHFDSTTIVEAFGTAVAGVGDVDGDQVDDVAVGAPGGDVESYVCIYSGADGSQIHRIARPVLPGGVRDTFGFSLAGVGDLDQDGYDDFIVGATEIHQPLQFPEPKNGYAQVFSGVDAQVLFTFDGDADGDSFGHDVDGAGDTDGDGIGDLLVCSQNAGYARLFSGADGSLLHEWSLGANCASAVAGVDDVNADGYDDCLVGCLSDDTVANDAGAARVYCGLSGSEILTLFGTEASERFGVGAGSAGDLNGDGSSDFWVGAQPLFAPSSSYLSVFSGSSGKQLYRHEGTWSSAAAAGDNNGDGLGDFLIGDESAGKVELHAGERWYLNATPKAVATGATLDRSVREGTPGTLLMIAIIDVSGTPIFFNASGIRSLDSCGELLLSDAIPGIVSGLTLTYQTLLAPPGGGIQLSNREVVEFL